MAEENTGTTAPVSGANTKLTDWKNEPSLLALKADLEAARPAHDTQISKIKTWTELLKVDGASKPQKIKGRSAVQPKLVRRQAEWRYSALTEPFLSSEKLFKVSPVTWEDADAAKQNELVLNWQFRTKLNRVKFIDDYVRAVVDEGTVIVRLSWKRVTKKVKEQVPVWKHFAIQNQQQMDLLQQAMDLKQSDPHDYEDRVQPDLKASVDYFEETQQPTFAVQDGTQEVEKEIVVANQPCTEILNPENVFIDPSCGGDFDKANFVVVSFDTNRADLEASGKNYINLDAVDWSSASPATDGNHVSSSKDTNFNFADKARKKVVAYEYWGFYAINEDKEGKGTDTDEDGEEQESDSTLVPFVATWIGNTLIRMELNPFPDEKLPFVVVPYMPIKRELYGEPDAELLGDNQAILGAVTRGMIDLLGRSANGQQGFAKGMLDPLNKRRYESGQDYEFNPNQNPQNGIVEHKYPDIPQSAMLMINLMNQDSESLTGVKSFSGGVSGETYGDIAAAVRGAMDAASKREMAILRRLAKGIQDIGFKIAAMNSEFLSEEETVRVTNDQFVQVKREDLKGNFDLIVDISTAEVDNAKAQDLGFMLQTLGPNVGPELSMMILAEIAELKRMPALAHKLRTYQPPPPTPEQQQMQQLELQKAQAEVAKLQAEAAYYGSRKAEADAGTSQKNLDFVEQETGTKHARDMERMQAQARGNQDLEVTKALTKPLKPGESRPNIAAAVGYNHLTTEMHRDENRRSDAPPQINVAPDPTSSYSEATQ